MKKIIITIITAFVSLSSFAAEYLSDSIMVQTSEGPVARYFLKYSGYWDWESKGFSYFHGTLRFYEGVTIKDIKILSDDKSWRLRFNAIDSKTVKFIGYNLENRNLFTSALEPPFISFDVVYPSDFSDEEKRIFVSELSTSFERDNNTYADNEAQCYLGERLLKITPSSVKLKIGESVKLETGYIPEGPKDFSWYNDASDIASFNEDGTITAIGVGKVTFTAEGKFGDNATCEVVVVDDTGDANGDGIITITMDDDSDIKIYDIEGRKLDNLKKGVNIIRMDDGTTRKVMKK